MAGNDDWSLYIYDPVKALPPIFAVIVLISGVWMIYQSFFKYNYKKLGVIFAWASSVWVAGFICREISIYNQQSVGIFIAQYALILTGPPIFAAAEYFVLGRMLAYVPYYSPIHPGRVASTFVFLGALVESLTANGAANAAGTGRSPSQVKAGELCIKVSLFVQAAIELMFLLMVLIVQNRARKSGKWPRNLKVLGLMLSATSFLVLVRCVFRIVDGFEYRSCGPKGLKCAASDRHEWLLWVWEVAVMVIYGYLLNFFHPGKYLPSNTNVYLDPVDGLTEREGPGWKDPRPFIFTVLDPFNIIGIFYKKWNSQKYWEQENPVVEAESYARRSEGLAGKQSRKDLEASQSD